MTVQGRPTHVWQEIRLADFFTLLNAVAGVTAMVAAARGHLLLAAELVLMGIILDGVDGAVARLGFGGSRVGAKLDSLSDGVSFAAAPAFLLALWRPDIVGYTMGAAILIAGLLRLARFEAMRETWPKPYFYGLTSPGAGMVVGAVVLSPTLAPAAPLLIGGAAVLMLMDFRLPKLRSWMGLTTVALIAAILAGHGQPWQEQVVWTTLVMLFLYLIAGPVWVRRKLDTGPSASGA